MNNKNIFAFFILCMVCFSCTKELPFPDAEVKPSMVLNAVFTPNGENIIHLTESCHIKDQDCLGQVIDDAQVVLKDKNDVVITMIDQVSNGFYNVPENVINFNEEYKIEVNHTNYETNKLVATNKIPKEFDVDFLSFGEVLIDNAPTWAFEIEIDDDPQSENYYLLEGRIESPNPEPHDGEDSAGANGYLLPRFAHYTNDLNAENKSMTAGIDIQTYPLRSIFLSDENFNGQKYKTTFGFRDDFLDIAVNNLKAHVSIKSVSKEMYIYFKTLELLRLSQGNPFAEPQQIYSNIEGGLGIFGSYSERTYVVELPKSEYNYPSSGSIKVENEGCTGPCTVKFNHDGGSKLNYFWDFGDGKTSLEPYPEHMYSTAGDYQASLTITSSGGDIWVYTLNVVIR